MIFLGEDFVSFFSRLTVLDLKSFEGEIRDDILLTDDLSSVSENRSTTY